MQGQIIRIISNLYTVKINDEIIDCRARGKFRIEGTTPVVGDYCIVDKDNNYILEILPRKNSLKRPVIANVDYALIVTSVKKPDLSLNLLDKLLSLSIMSNITPIICLTKLDLLNKEETKIITDIMKYYKVVNWIKELKLNLSHISLGFDSIKRVVLKQALLPKKHNALIINMKEDHTELLSYDGKVIEGTRIAPQGYSKFVSAISESFEIEYDKAYNDLKDGNDFDEILLMKDRKNFIRKHLSIVCLECKRIIGEALLEHNYDEVYLNIEGLDNKLIGDCLSKYLQFDISYFNTKDLNSKNFLSSLGATIKPNKTVDFDFPVNVKLYK